MFVHIPGATWDQSAIYQQTVIYSLGIHGLDQWFSTFRWTEENQCYNFVREPH